MIGCRLWSPGILTTNDTEEYFLSSVTSEYFWSDKKVSLEVPYLMTPYKDTFIGWNKDSNKYINDDKDITDDVFVWDDIQLKVKNNPYYGFHAYSSIDVMCNEGLYEIGGFISGLVKGYGIHHVDENTFRTSEMEILALFLEDQDFDARVGMRNLNTFKYTNLYSLTLKEYCTKISQKLNIPFISYNEAKEMEEEYATV